MDYILSKNSKFEKTKLAILTSVLVQFSSLIQKNFRKSKYNLKKNISIFLVFYKMVKNPNIQSRGWHLAWACIYIYTLSELTGKPFKWQALNFCTHQGTSMASYVRVDGRLKNIDSDLQGSELGGKFAFRRITSPIKNCEFFVPPNIEVTGGGPPPVRVKISPL